jgi:hypothetical protein
VSEQKSPNGTVDQDVLMGQIRAAYRAKVADLNAQFSEHHDVDLVEQLLRGAQSAEVAKIVQERSNGAGTSAGLLARRIDLGEFLRSGIPDVDYMPGELSHRMVYAIGVTGFSGHPKSMKTTLVCRLVLDAMRRGLHVVYLDWENGEDETARRFAALGAEDTILSERLIYLPFPGPPIWTEVAAVWDEFPNAVGIWDSTRGILRSLGLNEDKAAETGRFMDAVTSFALESKSPHMLIDHVTKTTTEHTGYSRGSGDKLAAVQAQWYVKCPNEITETDPGEIEVVRWAARSGYLNRRHRFAVGDGQGGLPFRRLDASQSPQARQERAIIGYLKGSDEPLSINKISEAVEGRDSDIGDLVKALAQDDERPVREVAHTGRGGGVRYEYAEDLDNEPQEAQSGLSVG